MFLRDTQAQPYLHPSEWAVASERCGRNTGGFVPGRTQGPQDRGDHEAKQ